MLKTPLQNAVATMIELFVISIYKLGYPVVGFQRMFSSGQKVIPCVLRRCMSSGQMTWAESVEALRYTTENKSKQNMLDRSRVSKNQKYVTLSRQKVTSL